MAHWDGAAGTSRSKLRSLQGPAPTLDDHVCEPVAEFISPDHLVPERRLERLVEQVGPLNVTVTITTMAGAAAPDGQLPLPQRGGGLARLVLRPRVPKDHASPGDLTRFGASHRRGVVYRVLARREVAGLCVQGPMCCDLGHDDHGKSGVV